MPDGRVMGGRAGSTTGSAAPTPGARTVLGISCDYHDAAAALVHDGRIVAAVEEERLSRRKHDDALPARAVASCLRIGGIDVSEIDVVAFYEQPVALMGRYLAARQRRGPRGLRSFVIDAPRLLGTNLMVGYRIDRMLRRMGATTTTELVYLEHHRSHAAAAFLPSPFSEAAILTIDGIGEWATASIGHGSGHRVDLLEEMRYPDSLGLLYSLFTAHLGFRPNEGEYKVMGLAPYGEPRFAEQLAELATVRPDGSVEVDARRLRWFAGTVVASASMRASFGPARRAGEPIEQRHADIAASLQGLLESSVLRMAQHAHELTGSSRLCLAGGVALNCVANGRVAREGPFDELWVQPAAGDAGSALGAALSVSHEQLGHERPVLATDSMRGARLGPRVERLELDRWLADRGIEHRSFEDRDELATNVAAHLADGSVVGWFEGRMEFGPRALGGRSILADPRDPHVRRRLNRQVKGREDFRPFAPAVLAEHAADWFDLDHASPYMLEVVEVAARRRLHPDGEPEDIGDRADVARSEIPACTHVDGSARVQTVDTRRAPEFHRLLSAFHRLTGCPVVLNTSFNVADEPIVATPDDALRTAASAGLDVLVIDHVVIEAASWAPALVARVEDA